VERKQAVKQWAYSISTKRKLSMVVTFRVGFYARRQVVHGAARWSESHDSPRTFAKLGQKGGSALDQIQLWLGHGSIQTTERYLGVKQDLTDAPYDHLGLRLRGCG
jgi:integrase